MGVIEGGTKANVVCEEAHATVDIRYLKKADLESVLKKIEKITHDSSVYNPLLKLGTRAEFELLGKVTSMPREFGPPFRTGANSFRPLEAPDQRPACRLRK